MLRKRALTVGSLAGATRRRGRRAARTKAEAHGRRRRSTTCSSSASATRSSGRRSRPRRPSRWSRRTALLEVAAFCKNDPDARLRQPDVPLGRRLPEGEPPRLEVVYHLLSLHALPHASRSRCSCRARAPRSPSVESLWGVANWHEREAWDLFGIVFTGHSDLRRILLPDDWQGHPLRKDWQDPDYYNGMHVKPTAQMAERVARRRADRCRALRLHAAQPRPGALVSTPCSRTGARDWRRGRARHRRDGPQHGPAASRPRTACCASSSGPTARSCARRGRTSATCTAASRSTPRTSTTPASCRTPTAWTTWRRWATRSATRSRSRSSWASSRARTCRRSA